MSDGQGSRSADARDEGPASADWQAGHAACGPSDGKKLEAEGEVAVARLAMDGGDLAHAAGHLGFAVAEDPRLPEVHEALAELAARAGGPDAALDLFPMENPYIGAVVCRAHLSAAFGQWDEALGLLASAIGFQPDAPWAQVAWIEDPALPAALSADVLFQLVMRVNSGVGMAAGPVVAEAVAPFYRLVRAGVARHPDDPDLLSAVSGLARRLGDLDDGVAWARRAHGIRPDHMSAVMLGNALRAAGDPQGAIAVWEAELARDGSDLYLVVDLAELYSALGQHQLALQWIEKALAADPDHELAVPARHGVRHAADGDMRHLVALADLARDRPEWDYSLRLLAQHSDGQPWLGRVASATEATTNTIHQVLADPAIERDSAITFTLSALETPSSQLTLRMVFPNIEVSFGKVDPPDLRESLRPVGVSVWHYEGHQAMPATAPPKPATVELLRGMASATWPCLPAAFDHAIALSAVSPDELLAVLVHPPTPTDPGDQRLFDLYPDLWIRAVQAFACLGIAHHRGDEPWPGSVRRGILSDLLFGPEDWVTEAAGFALVATAWAAPETREDVGRLIVERLTEAARAYQTREVTILGSLCRLTLACPWMDAQFTALAKDVLASIARNEEGIGAQPAESSAASRPPEKEKRRKLFGKH